MKNRFFLKTITATLLFGCSQNPENQTLESKPKEVIYLPTRMIQKSDGSLYSPNNYLIERSKDDIEVMVTSNHIDTLSK